MEPSSQLKVICLEERAFFELVERVVDRLSDKNNEPDQWIGTEEAMKLLRVKSKTTLQNLRDAGEIRFSQPKKRIILYDRKSLEEYINKNAREPFA